MIRNKPGWLANRRFKYCTYILRLNHDTTYSASRTEKYMKAEGDNHCPHMVMIVLPKVAPNSE